MKSEGRILQRQQSGRERAQAYLMGHNEHEFLGYKLCPTINQIGDIYMKHR